MGGSCSIQGVKQMTNNPDWKIGQQVNINPGCGYAGTAQNSLQKYIPNNGEYVWAGENGGCHFCGAPPNQISCSTGCTGGCCAIIGAQGSFKRVSYNANPLQCCLKQTKVIGNVTCDPKYRLNTKPDCRPLLQKYCEDPKNFPNSTCQPFCSQELAANRSTCDVAAQNYCNANPSDPHCGCLNPPEKINEIRKEYGDIVGDITCWYDGCQISKNPYMTLAMKNVKDNCKTTNCIIKDINVETNGKINNLNIMNKCGIPPPVPEQEHHPEEHHPEENYPEENYPEEHSSKKNIRNSLLDLLKKYLPEEIIILVLIIILIIIISWKKKKY